MGYSNKYNITRIDFVNGTMRCITKRLGEGERGEKEDFGIVSHQKTLRFGPKKKKNKSIMKSK